LVNVGVFENISVNVGVFEKMSVNVGTLENFFVNVGIFEKISVNVGVLEKIKKGNKAQGSRIAVKCLRPKYGVQKNMGREGIATLL